MSIHSSLRSGGKDKKHRSVLKRYERLKTLKEKNLWSEDRSPLGIAKVKMQRIRVKKEKAAPAETAAAPGAAAPAGAGKPAAGAAALASPGAKGEKK